ncbi:MAG: helix-hairpin-helix domain-containing protein [Planctomycetota bacterium]|nr:helix-hairpin-helix domain-containing protein [Planctomycetota bacterium]MDA1213975.1 helix-hairpin-helix domain-containing protein [Planctomycetota bacterium]
MITKITGKLVKLREEEATLEIGAFEYQVFIPEFVRRQLQPLVGEQISLKTIQYIDGNPQKGRLIPRMIGFLHEAEVEFFDHICSVDGVGMKKTLRAMVRPVREIASAIEEGDLKQLATLPGIGPAVAERIVAKLRRKMVRFAVMAERDVGKDGTAKPDLYQEAFEALVSLGYTAGEARAKIDDFLEKGNKLKSVEDFITDLYRQERR